MQFLVLLQMLLPFPLTLSISFSPVAGLLLHFLFRFFFCHYAVSCSLADAAMQFYVDLCRFQFNGTVITLLPFLHTFPLTLSLSFSPVAGLLLHFLFRFFPSSINGLVSHDLGFGLSAFRHDDDAHCPWTFPVLSPSFSPSFPLPLCLLSHC